MFEPLILLNPLILLSGSSETSAVPGLVVSLAIPAVSALGVTANQGCLPLRRRALLERPGPPGDATLREGQLVLPESGWHLDEGEGQAWRLVRGHHLCRSERAKPLSPAAGRGDARPQAAGRCNRSAQSKNTIVDHTAADRRPIDTYPGTIAALWLASRTRGRPAPPACSGTWGVPRHPHPAETRRGWCPEGDPQRRGVRLIHSRGRLPGSNAERDREGGKSL